MVKVGGVMGQGLSTEVTHLGFSSDITNPSELHSVLRDALILPTMLSLCSEVPLTFIYS